MFQTDVTYVLPMNNLGSIMEVKEDWAVIEKKSLNKTFLKIGGISLVKYANIHSYAQLKYLYCHNQPDLMRWRFYSDLH